MLVAGSGPAPGGAPPGAPGAAGAAPGGGAPTLVASPVLSSWQFTTAGVLHLPLFELHGPLPASAAAREFMVGQPEPVAAAAAGAPGAPRPQWADAGAAAGAAASSGGGASAPSAGPPSRSVSTVYASLPPPGAPAPAAGAAGACGAGAGARRSAGVWLLRMYGRVYLAHVAQRGGSSMGAPSGGGGGAGPAQLELYRFYSDTILLERVYDLVDANVRPGGAPLDGAPPDGGCRLGLLHRNGAGAVVGGPSQPLTPLLVPRALHPRAER
jgi:hypothetical protein